MLMIKVLVKVLQYPHFPFKIESTMICLKQIKFLPFSLDFNIFLMQIYYGVAKLGRIFELIISRL